jgi:hypothetical protein
MFRPAACLLYSASAVLLVLGIGVLAVPFVVHCSFATHYCKAWGDVTLADRAFHMLYAGAVALIAAALLGCCLASSGKRRFKLPFATLLLALTLALSAAAVWQADKGTALEKLGGYRPGRLDKAVADLQTDLARDFYHDFSVAYTAGKCVAGAAELTCPDCGVLQNVLDRCVETWVSSNESQTFLNQCATQLAGYEQKCDGTCTRVFCQCASMLREELEQHETYVLYGFGGVLSVLLVVLVAACCVQRKMREQSAVTALRDPMLPVAAGELRLA